MKPRKRAALVGSIGVVLACSCLSLSYIFPKENWSIEEGTTLDLGIRMLRSEVEAGFTFVNTGSSPLRLVIEGVSCRCLKTSWKEAVVEPGQRRSLGLTIRAGSVPGPFGSTATVHAYQGRSDSTASLHVTGQAREAVKASPSSLHFGGLDYGELPSTKSITLTKGDIPGLASNRITEVSSNLPFVHLELTEATPEKVVIAATVGDDAPCGTSHGNVKVSFDLGYTNAMFLPVYVDLQGPFSLSPDTVFFGKVNRGEPCERTCTVTGIDDTDTISKPVVGGELAQWLAADVGRKEGFSRVRTSLRVDEEMAGGAVADGYVEFEIARTERPGTYKVRIPVRAILPASQ